MADLLTDIRAEIDARMRELEPALAEFAQLSTAAQALDAEGAVASRSAAATELAKPAKVAKPAASRRSARAAAPARGSEQAKATQEKTIQAKTTPAKPARRGRKREQPGQPAHTPIGQAILAALEHGSHTLAELVVVTALSASEIREALRQLRRRRAIVKTDRDGKAAYALPASGAE